jgi:branched-chain amino acid transport system permease protein
VTYGSKKVSLSMKRNRVNSFGIVGLIILLALVPLFLESYYLHLAVLVFIYVMATSSLRTIYISGQMSLGHAAFMGIGAYTSAMLAKHLGWPLWCTMPLGGLAAMIIGVLVGLPFSRLRAIYFSMASLFFGMMMTTLVGLAPEWTGHYAGLQAIPRLFGFSKVPYYYFFLVLVVLTLIILYRFEYSRLGMTFKSVAQSYLAASSRGINEGGIRILSLGIGGFFAGIAGAGYAHFAGFIAPDQFGVMPSIFLLVYLLAGGKGNFAGPTVGTAILYLIPYAMSGFEGYAPFFQAAAVFAVLYLIPDGMIGLPKQITSRVRRQRDRKRAGYAT